MTVAGQVFHVAAGQPLLDVLANHILRTHQGDNPLHLADVTVWLPSQRAVKALREAFVAQAGAGLVLPRMRAMQLNEGEQDALGFADVDELHDLIPPVDDMARLMFLVEQLMARDDTLTQENAFAAAEALIRLVDRLHTHDVPLEKLRDIVPHELAAHWQKNLAFLEVVLSVYPAWLKSGGVVDKAVFRNRLLHAEAARIDAEGLAGATYAAGFSDTTPAGVALLKAILAHPQGVLVVPGEAPSIDKLPATHAAYTLHQLLQALGVSKTQRLGGEATPRAQLWQQALLPAGHTTAWLDTPLPENATDGLTLIEAKNDREEADTIALLMREVLADPDKTCALVTPRRSLGRRVAEKLAAWGVNVNDSGGEGLLMRPAGSFALAVVHVVEQQFSPLAVASLIHHPMARFGYAPGVWRTRARALDALVLRGPQTESGLAGLRKRLASVVADNDKLPEPLVAEAEAALADLTRVFEGFDSSPAPVATWVERHIKLAERIAAGENGEDADRFLTDDDGEALAKLFTDWRAVDNRKPMPLATYSRWLQTLAGRVAVRVKANRHPRLFIWGPLEARGQKVDRMIIGAVNEGDWPNIPTPDPWLGQRIGVELGLPPLEVAMGMNAHDFWMLASMPEVFMTRAKKSEGTVCLPSRFLERLRARLSARDEGKTLWNSLCAQGEHYLALGRKLDRQTPAVAVPPAVLEVPKVLRPMRWSASLVRNLMQCPYRAALAHVFNVQPLEPYEQAPDALERGNMLHLMLDAFYRDHSAEGLPKPFEKPLSMQTRDEAAAHLKSIADAVLSRLSAPTVKAMWRERFARVADAFIDAQIDLLNQGRSVAYTEYRREMNLGEVKLHARMDRVDKTPEGYVILDYKTGETPTSDDVALGREPQLAIEALLFQNEGKSVAEIEFWKIFGTIAVEAKSARGSKNIVPLDEIMANAHDGLQRLKTHMIDDAAPMQAIPGGESPLERKGICRHCDFAGVCRFAEWVQGDRP